MAGTPQRGRWDNDGNWQLFDREPSGETLFSDDAGRFAGFMVLLLIVGVLISMFG